MIKKIVCIECPNGCELQVEVQEDKVLWVKNHKCDKGEVYARSEVEAPTRVLTASVLVEGLSLKMLPVKTDKPIPKDLIFFAMEEVLKIRISKSVNMGEVIVARFLDLDVNLVATRSVE